MKNKEAKEQNPSTRVDSLAECDFPGCGKVFKRKSFCKTHKLYFHGPNSERPFKCDFEGCSASYMKSYHLNRHKVITHSRPQGEFKCQADGCVASFETQLNLNQHFKRAHYKVIQKLADPLENFRCETCDKRFAKESKLLEHSACHTKLKPFKCETCGEEFDLHYVYKKHTRAHGKQAEKSKEVICSTCNTKFETAKGLSIHKKLKHPTIHSCELCGLHFSSIFNLRAHTNTHAEIRTVFPCTMENCGKIYYYERGLNEHIRRIHNRVLHTCPYCEKNLSSKQKLGNHIKLHDWIPRALPPKPEPKCKIRKVLSRRLKKPTDPENLFKVKPNFGRPKGILRKSDVDSSNWDSLTQLQDSASETISTTTTDLNSSQIVQSEEDKMKIDLDYASRPESESIPTVIKQEEY